MGDPIEHHLGDRALTLIGFGSGLVIDRSGQAIERAAAVNSGIIDLERLRDRAAREIDKPCNDCRRSGRTCACSRAGIVLGEVIERGAGETVTRTFEGHRIKREGGVSGIADREGVP